jgi:DNA-directed RNA polymerase specialized sigma24 family protein
VQTEELDAITQDQWVEIWQKLRLHAWKRYGSLRDKIGVDLDDMVHQAIADTLQGKRRWPPIDKLTGEKKRVDLFPFLCEVIRSNVSHQLEEERKKVSIEGTVSDSLEDSDLISLEEMITEPISEYLRYEAIYNRVFYAQLVSKMYEMVKEDEELSEIVRVWTRDPNLKPKEIAQELGLSIEEVRNAQKRLRRKLRDIREE